MDPGRYGPQQGWDTNSAFEGYHAVQEPEFRAGDSYGSRRYSDERFSRDSHYGRNSFHRDGLARDNYPPLSHVTGVWSQPRKNFDAEYPTIRDGRRHMEPFHGMDHFRNSEKYREVNSFNEINRFHDDYHSNERYYDTDSYRGYYRFGTRDHDEMYNDYEFRNYISYESRETSRDREYDYGRYSYDSDHEKSKRDSSWRRRDSRDRDHERRGLSRESDQSPYRRHERSRSRGHDGRSRSRSPRGRRHDRSYREDSYDDGHYDRSDRRRDYDRDIKRNTESSVAPSPTVIVKGLSQKTTDEDLYQILAAWGPLRHVRVIRERNSGVSRGFAFIDFPDVEAACKMMDAIGESGLVIDGRKLFFEYSSKPTGGAGAPSLGQESASRSSYGQGRSITAPSDWMCVICGCVNFARRTSCFQCNEARPEDAPPADLTTSNTLAFGKRGSDLGPTHVLVVRGLDENADEDMLRYEFAKHAPIKDLRLVRDKFTHVSRGFAFVHFHSVEDATKALEATNGITLEKNGQVLRVAYAKSIHGPGSGGPQSSSLAAAAIEAATFAQQYDAVGWAPKEYNPDQQQTGATEQNGGAEAQKSGSAPQSGFVWDEKSGYYYDAASGFYYDGNSGLYYDGSSGIWYSYDNTKQQYVPCTDQSGSMTIGDPNNQQTSDSANQKPSSGANKKVIISAPAATIKTNEKTSLADAVQAAATAALAAEKKEKERVKDIKLASRTSIVANKKKMHNVLAMWKQRNNEGQAARVELDEHPESSSLLNDKQNNPHSVSGGLSVKNKTKSDVNYAKDAHSSAFVSRGATQTIPVDISKTDSQIKPKPISNSAGGTIMGVIRGSGRGIIKSDTIFTGSAVDNLPVTSSSDNTNAVGASSEYSDVPSRTPFKTDVSALGSYPSVASAGSGKRRFSEAPVSGNRDQIPTGYRDRAAERRNLYGSSASVGLGDSDSEYPNRKGSSSEMGSMPFPPGVGGMKDIGDALNNADCYEIIPADRAIDESNVGNKMLRSMGWREGLGLGKDGGGIKEPVQAKSVGDRSGLGAQQKTMDPTLEAQAGDSYRTIIQKKAIARFREMS